MNEILNSIKKSIDTENWHSALFVSLIVPDICSKLEYPSVATNQRYPEWFDNYIADRYKDRLTGKDCFALRCSCIHEGSNVIETQWIRETIDRFEFTPTGHHLSYFGKNYSDMDNSDNGKEICFLSVKDFGEDMIKAAKKWLIAVKNNAIVQNEINAILKIKPPTTLYGGAIKFI
jgi:hypothetical protein